MNPNVICTWKTPGATLVMWARSSGATRGSSAVSIATIRVHLWRTLLCFKLFTSAGGALPRSLNKKTAVPETRFTSSVSSRTSSIGRSPRWMRSATSMRPRRQVCIWIIRMIPTASANQPPCGILIRLAPRNPSSITNSGIQTANARNRLQFHRSVSTRKKMRVVMAIVIVTAMPYAAAKLLAVRNPRTSPIQAIIRAQLTSGT